MRRSSFVTAACLVLVFAVGSVGLSSCGGGGGMSVSTGAPSGGRAPARELVITPPADHAPRAVGSIPAQTLTAGGNAHGVDVAPYFQDPDGDRLTYSAISSRPGTVAVRMSGSTMTLTPVSAGTASVTVTAGDGNADATQTVAATVQAESSGRGGGTTVTESGNRPPEAVGSIPTQALTAGGNARSVNVAPYFRDPDGDRLTYSAASSRPGTVTASMSGSTITLTPVSAGTASVTVTASDGDASATQTVAATVQAPDRGLTGVRIQLQGRQTRRTGMRITMEPANAPWSNINFVSEPYYAGEMCCYESFAESIYVNFICSESYTGAVTITTIVSGTNGRRIEEPVSFPCR